MVQRPTYLHYLGEFSLLREHPPLKKKTKSFQEILSDPVSCPAIVLRLTLLTLSPKPCLMESIRCVYPHTNSSKLSFGSGIKSHSLNSPKELKPEILEEIPTKVIWSLGEFGVWVFS